MANIEIPDDMVLSPSDKQRERDLNSTLLDWYNLISIALNSLTDALTQAEADIDALEAGGANTDELVKGTSSDSTSGFLDSKVDDVNFAVDVSNFRIRVKDGSDLDTSIDTITQILSGIIQGDILYVDKDISNNLFFDKLSPAAYGSVLVCGGADAAPFWDGVSGVPRAELNPSYTVTTEIIQLGLVTGVKTVSNIISKEVQIDDESDTDTQEQLNDSKATTEVNTSVISSIDSSSKEVQISTEVTYVVS